jgi:hypothetical protein
MRTIWLELESRCSQRAARNNVRLADAASSFDVLQALHYPFFIEKVRDIVGL